MRGSLPVEPRMYQDPATAGKDARRRACHRSHGARCVIRSFGAWCEVGARSKVAESSFGDYSYVANDSDITYTTLGRFCSIAAQVRINPGNHPLDRVALNHFTYRSSAYGLGEDDAAFFDWRRSHRVVLGHRCVDRPRGGGAAGRHHRQRGGDRRRRGGEPRRAGLRGGGGGAGAGGAVPLRARDRRGAGADRLVGLAA